MALDTISVDGRQERRIHRRQLQGLLSEAGLEIWQAPEGFWAVRLKLAPVPPLLARPRRRPLRRVR
jgi:hypothetical protein